MRPGVGDSTAWTNALAAQGVTTAVLARFDFLSETIFAWTGPFTLQVTGSGDSLLDGNTFEPIAEGIFVDIGANQFNYSGSEAMPLTMAIPSSPTTAMANSAHNPLEWQSRTCIIWRCVMQTPANATTPASFVFKRVRAGSMDQLKITNDGVSHKFSMTIEAHASMISAATASTYLDQKTRFDSTDTSQDYAVSIANNPNSPTRAGSGVNGGVYGGGDFGGGGVGGRFGRNFSQSF